MSGPLYARGPGDYDFVPLTQDEATWWGVAVPNDTRPGCFLVTRYANDMEADKAATGRARLVFSRPGSLRWHFAGIGGMVPR